MTALRPFTRPVVMLWLCAFVLFLGAPVEVFAKRDMTNGNDSLEGDPTDTVESGGSDGGLDLPFGAEWESERKTRDYDSFLLISIVLFVPGHPYYSPFSVPLLVPSDYLGGER
ncbi:MAG: hypothetical protein R6X35_08045 [Candidatus Krumholzibacteriia bacterium]